MSENKNVLPLNVLFIAIITILLGIGVGFLYSASQPVSERSFSVSHHIVKKQLIYIGIGFILMIIGTFLDHHTYRKYIKQIILLTLILLIVTLIPGVTKEIMGARRWITFAGFSLQPSEIAKFIVIVYLSAVLANKKDVIYDFYKGVFPPLVLVGLMSFLIFLENDFSTTFLILLFTFVMFFLADVKGFTLFMMSLIGVFFSVLMIIMAPYRIKRMFAFINPWDDPLGSGWQCIQSMKCFALGGFFGRGIGESTQKIVSLPEAHNDYIFAIIAEEGGGITAILIAILFFSLAFVGLNIAKRTDDKYSFLLASGVTVLIFIQSFINIGVVLSVFPATGITLPFISAGGTSIIIFMFMVGVLLNISLSAKKRGL